jgi:hypothetical protein
MCGFLEIVNLINIIIYFPLSGRFQQDNKNINAGAVEY